MAKSSKKSKKSESKIIPQPQFLLMASHNVAFAPQRFDAVVVGSPFVHEDSIYLKVGASTAICLQAGEDREDRLPKAAGLKLTFRKSCKVELVNVDLTVRMLDGLDHSLSKIVKFSREQSLEVGANAGNVPAVDHRSDITQSVIERAS